MDIMARAKRLIEIASHPQPGDTVMSFSRRLRRMSLKKWQFWQCFCYVLKAEMQAIAEIRIDIPPASALVVAFTDTAVIFYVAQLRFAPPKTDWSKRETARDPPHPFVPIPNKTELGGCARSDSLVRSLVF